MRNEGRLEKADLVASSFCLYFFHTTFFFSFFSLFLFFLTSFLYSLAPLIYSFFSSPHLTSPLYHSLHNSTPLTSSSPPHHFSPPLLNTFFPRLPRPLTPPLLHSHRWTEDGRGSDDCSGQWTLNSQQSVPHTGDCPYVYA